MYGRPRGGLQHYDTWTQDMTLEICACQAHRDAFFLRRLCRKGSSVPRAGRVVVGRWSAGGRGRIPKGKGESGFCFRDGLDEFVGNA